MRSGANRDLWIENYRSLTINQLINLANYCGGEKTLSPSGFQHCGGERPRCPRGSDAFGSGLGSISHSLCWMIPSYLQGICVPVSTVHCTVKCQSTAVHQVKSVRDLDTSTPTMVWAIYASRGRSGYRWFFGLLIIFIHLNMVAKKQYKPRTQSNKVN